MNCCSGGLRWTKSKKKKNDYWPRGRFSDIWALINFRSRGQKRDIRLKKGRGVSRVTRSRRRANHQLVLISPPAIATRSAVKTRHLPARASPPFRIHVLRLLLLVFLLGFFTFASAQLILDSFSTRRSAEMLSQMFLSNLLIFELRHHALHDFLLVKCVPELFRDRFNHHPGGSDVFVAPFRGPTPHHVTVRSAHVQCRQTGCLIRVSLEADEHLLTFFS